MVDVLVFSAHPDDAEFGMGATLIKLKEQGLSLAICVLTNGQSGTYGNENTRKKEMRAAATLLGAELEMLGLQDCAIHDTQKNRELLTSVIRKYAPTTIFAPYYKSNKGYKDGQSHPDHSMTGALVKKAARFARFKNMSGVQGVAHEITHLYYYMLAQQQPSMYVNVSECMTEFKKLLHTHKSQLQIKDGEVAELLIEHRKSMGRSVGCEYAEGFYSDETQELHLNNLQ